MGICTSFNSKMIMVADNNPHISYEIQKHQNNCIIGLNRIENGSQDETKTIEFYYMSDTFDIEIINAQDYGCTIKTTFDNNTTNPHFTSVTFIKTESFGQFYYKIYKVNNQSFKWSQCKYGV